MQLISEMEECDCGRIAVDRDAANQPRCARCKSLESFATQQLRRATKSVLLGSPRPWQAVEPFRIHLDLAGFAA